MEFENKVLDCTMNMRRYILKTKQTTWTKIYGRIVVWSPCEKLPSTKKAKSIPILRHQSKQNHQEVRFISTNDIEKDSSPVYAREKVATTQKLKATHGVAVVDSSPPNENYCLGHGVTSVQNFSYKRGDRFWLNIDNRLKNEQIGELAVPVINLQTYETGTIHAQHVCWFPSAMAPSGDLWTFGGLQKATRGERKQNWIWAVIQSIGDGTTKCDMVEVMHDCEMKFPEKFALFRERLSYMEQRQKEARNVPKYHPTIYRSPLSALRKMLIDAKNNTKLAKKARRAAFQSVLSAQTWRSSYSVDERPTKRRCSTLSTTSPPEDEIAEIAQPSRSSSPICYTPKLPSSTESPYSAHDEVDRILESLYAAKPLNKPFLATYDISHDPTLIRAAYDRACKYANRPGRMAECGSVLCLKESEDEEHIAEEHAKMASIFQALFFTLKDIQPLVLTIITQSLTWASSKARFCSEGDPKCRFTHIVPIYRRRPHIHHPAQKCIFNRVDPEGAHVHCVSFHDFPGIHSRCVFRHWNAALKSIIDEGYQHTTCCVWIAKDLKKSNQSNEIERARNFIPPQLRPAETFGAKRGMIVMPQTVDRTKYVKRPDPTQADFDALRRDAQLLLSFWAHPWRDFQYPWHQRDGSMMTSVENEQSVSGEDSLQQIVRKRSYPEENTVGNFPLGFDFRTGYDVPPLDRQSSLSMTPTDSGNLKTPSNEFFNFRAEKNISIKNLWDDKPMIFPIVPPDTTYYDVNHGPYGLHGSMIDLDQAYFDQYKDLWLTAPPIEFSIVNPMAEWDQNDSNQNLHRPKWNWKGKVSIDADY